MGGEVGEGQRLVQPLQRPLTGGIVDTAGLRPGQRALIHAASGGVGHLAVQIAKARGAHVIGTVLGKDRQEFVRGLGADEAIDNATTDFVATVGDVDFVLDTLSGDIRSRSLSILRPDGTMVTTVPNGAADAAEREAGQGGRVRMIGVQADHAGMNAIADLAASGALRPRIHATFPLAKAAEAHVKLENERTTGKIVLVVGGQEDRNAD
ncbi:MULTISPECIES: zinc-binding dehydrogenase [unclassified Streptomyces]|uniref:zinc-binding dehydrogenase n=1 Tax=unclassified Streptomyces TaxID=2593676 RepID=UPI00324B67F8